MSSRKLVRTALSSVVTLSELIVALQDDPKEANKFLQ
jgi:hypothetical protein